MNSPEISQGGAVVDLWEALPGLVLQGQAVRDNDGDVPEIGTVPRVDGTTWRLSEHIGKGSDHDPRQTIRIAFAWDEGK